MISLILDLQEDIYNKAMKTYYMSGGFAGRHVAGVGDLSIDIVKALRPVPPIRISFSQGLDVIGELEGCDVVFISCKRK